MKICTSNGLDMVILTRNEHCPPHAHVGTPKWDARFQFSYWHNGVTLWDVLPSKNEPSARLLEALRQTLKQAQHLRLARELWWASRQTICLDNQKWDLDAEEVISPKTRRSNALTIVSGHFDVQLYRTLLLLKDQVKPLEIEL